MFGSHLLCFLFCLFGLGYAVFGLFWVVIPNATTPVEYWVAVLGSAFIGKTLIENAAQEGLRALALLLRGEEEDQ